MLKTIWVIIKKECSRFLKDWRLIFGSIILPCLLTYGMYTLMGQGMSMTQSVDEEYTFQCYVQHAPASYEPIFQALNFQLMTTEDPQAARDSVAHKDADLVVLFDEDFDQRLLNPGENGLVPNIEVYYNYDSNTSSLAYKLFLAATEELETSIFNALDVNRGVENPNVSEGMSSLFDFMPALVMMLLFSSCLSFATESIAGEKERGTFATLLVTPVSRSAIAVGKITSLSAFATLAGLANFIGTMLGMRNMFPADAEGLFPVYGMKEYGLMLALIVTTVLMAVSVLSVISAFAKSVKEANSSTGAMTAIASLGSMVTMYPVAFSGIWCRCIPVLGTALSMGDIFKMEYAASDIAVTCASNLVVMLAMVLVLAKMFNSEKVMFAK